MVNKNEATQLEDTINASVNKKSESKLLLGIGISKLKDYGTYFGKVAGYKMRLLLFHIDEIESNVPLTRIAKQQIHKKLRNMLNTYPVRTRISRSWGI